MPKRGEHEQVEVSTEQKPTSVPPTPAVAPSAANEIPDLADSLWWSYWEGPYGFSFS
jgi:hypothetical protein